MGSSSSRHSAEVPERRDRGDYPAARRETSGGGVNSTGGLGRCESQPRREPHRRIRNGLRSARQAEVHPGFIPVASTSRGSGTLKDSSSGGEVISSECPVVDQPNSTLSASEGSSSTTVPVAHYGAQVAEISRTLESAGASAVLVVETFPSEISESPSAGITGGGQSRSTGVMDSQSLWLEGHPPWNSRFGSSLGTSASETPSLIGLSEASRQNLQAVCENTLQQHRVNEMQERLRRYAGLPPPSFDFHDLERRDILSAESSGARDNRMQNNTETGDASSSVSGSERDEYPFRSTPASLQAWEITEEGRLIEYRHSVYSESWDRHLAFHRSELHNGSSERSNTAPGPASSSTPISSAGRESRRNGGRRLWDALTRAASHRRTTTMTVPTTESVIESWMQNDDDQIDFGGFHSRSLDLEERRRRVRSQVWALQLLSNGLEGMPGFTRPCVSGGHHHGHCSCDVHGSAAEDTSTRASISRIIMLAEALFEVLDEIHRQSIALSRTSVPIASLPAPDTVVNAIPTRKISKKLREEAIQCNICLVEYEEGDQVRVLPCHHEYHVACVDKWLKEVHRVCPLCRGNVCEANSVPVSA